MSFSAKYFLTGGKFTLGKTFLCMMVHSKESPVDFLALGSVLFKMWDILKLAATAAPDVVQSTID